MSNGRVITQACEILRKTYSEINKMKHDLEEIFQNTKPQLELTNEYSYKATELRNRDWHVILFREPGKAPVAKKDGYAFVMIFIFCNNQQTKNLTTADEPELWCGLFEISNAKEEINLWNTACLTKEKEGFSPENLEIGGTIHRYFYDKKDKYGKWDGKFIGYKLTDIASVDGLKKLIVDKLFNK